MQRASTRPLDLVLFPLFLLAACSTVQDEGPRVCPGEPTRVTGTVYCDNKFTLWVNGDEVAGDPIAFTPHQAVRVSFDWDGTSDLTYAVQCEDYASESGYEYVATERAQLGDGALIAEFDDGLGTVTSENWRVHTVTFGPIDASIERGCGPANLEACEVGDRGTPEGWTEPGFDDSTWTPATTYSARQAGWGRPPRWSADAGCCGMTSPVDRSDLGCDKSVSEEHCLDPRDELGSSDAEFLWAEDLERDNRVLFRYIAECQAAM